MNSLNNNEKRELTTLTSHVVTFFISENDFNCKICTRTSPLQIKYVHALLTHRLEIKVAIGSRHWRAWNWIVFNTKSAIVLK